MASAPTKAEAAPEAKSGSGKKANPLEFIVPWSQRREPSPIRSLFPLMKIPGMMTFAAGECQPVVAVTVCDWVCLSMRLCLCVSVCVCMSLWLFLFVYVSVPFSVFSLSCLFTRRPDGDQRQPGRTRSRGADAFHRGRYDKYQI